MKAPTLDELVLLPEPLALQRHFDVRNYRLFRWFSIFLTLATLGGIIGSLDQGRVVSAGIYIANLVLWIVLVALRRSAVFERSFRQILMGYLGVEILILKYTTLLMEGDDALPLFILSTFLLLVLRLRLAELLVIFGSFWIAAVLPPGWLGLPAEASLGEGGIAAVTTMTILSLLGAVGLTLLERRRFLRVWRQEHARHAERVRLKEEIEYARKIQLSMLPQGPPEVDWLELAAASLPATEVGGDYYDTFPLGPSRLALVVGDVAGHGLASGLLLSGVRSCLYLLAEELAEPVPVLAKLNRMVRRTTDKRTYVTLLAAVLDQGQGSLTVASAGHPPVLRYDPRTRSFDEVGRGAPPLGTFLDAAYECDQRPLRAGDLLVFYTDGLVEARNVHGQEYGDARLRKAVGRAAGSRTAREIRDAVLGDLSNFKGDEEQADDITLLIVRLR